jgi:hypothetical protein
VVALRPVTKLKPEVLQVERIRPLQHHCSIALVPGERAGCVVWLKTRTGCRGRRLVERKNSTRRGGAIVRERRRRPFVAQVHVHGRSRRAS